MKLFSSTKYLISLIIKKHNTLRPSLSMCASREIGETRAMPLNVHHCTGCPVGIGGGIHSRHHALVSKTVFKVAEGGSLQPI